MSRIEVATRSIVPATGITITPPVWSWATSSSGSSSPMADTRIRWYGAAPGRPSTPGIAALAITAKRGRVIVTNIHPAMETTANISLLDLTFMEKQVVGSMFGSANPRADIPRLLELYRNGQFDLDAMVTQTYDLDGVNQGYDDMKAGKNIRGVLLF